MNTFLTIFFLLVIISLVVVVHEFGHFAVAKLFKMNVREFAVGFGKILFSRDYKGTKYSIRAIPFGGFVELEGENDAKDPNSFRNRPFYQKFLVLVAGVFMNIVLAVVLLSIFLQNNQYKYILPKITEYTFNNTQDQKTYLPVTVIEVDPEGRSAGVLEAGDVIVGINEKFFTSSTEFSELLKANQNTKITLNLLNGDTFDTYTKELDITEAKENGAILDVTLNLGSPLVYYVKYNQNITAGASMTYDIFVYQVDALAFLVTESSRTGDYSELSRSVGGLPQVTDQINLAVEYNALSFLIPLTAFINISLAFFNILPFPALDGGQIVISGVEALTKRKLRDDILSKINLFGFIILILLGILINVKDIIQLGWIQDLVNVIRNALGR